MPPPTSILSTRGSRCCITPSLSETLAPPSTTTYGRPDRRAGRQSACYLGRKQRAGGRREQFGDADGRGVGTMSRAERIEHKHVREVRKAGCQLRRVLFLPCFEAGVLRAQQPCPKARSTASVANRSAGNPAQLHCWKATELAEPSRHRRHAERRVDALRPAEVAAHDNLSTSVPAALYGRQTGSDPKIVRDRTVIQRHVQVGAQQDTLSADVERIHRWDRSTSTAMCSANLDDGGRLQPRREARSTRRLE